MSQAAEVADLAAALAAEPTFRCVRQQRRDVDRFDVDVRLTGSCEHMRADRAVDYAAHVEVTRIVLDGTEYDARDFPRGFVKSLQGRLTA
jgi:hypothetical protein